MMRPTRLASLALAWMLAAGLLPVAATVPAASAAVDNHGLYAIGDRLLADGTPVSDALDLRGKSVSTIDATTEPPGAGVVLLVDTSYQFQLRLAEGPLVVGTYEDATWGTSSDLTRNYLSLRPSVLITCPSSDIVGRFIILEDPVVEAGVVTRFAVDFELRCGGQSQMRGGLRVHSPIPFHTVDPSQTHDQLWMTIPLNATMSKTIVIAAGTNPAFDDPITVGAPSVTGPDAASFAVSATTCVPGELAVGASCTATVVFDPIAEGPVRAILTVPVAFPLGDLEVDLFAAAGPIDTSNVPGATSVTPATFYPYPDTYADTVKIRGYNTDISRVRVDIRNSLGTLVRRFSHPNLVQFGWSTTWNGRNNAGSIVPAGRYRITTVYTDLAGNVGSASVWVTVSLKRLYTYSKTFTLYANQFAASGRGGTGKISTVSSYSRGRKLISGSSGYAALGYSFTLPAATRYTRFTFKVTGRSTNSRRAIIGIQNFGISSSWVVEAFDVVAVVGPGYKTWPVTTTITNHHRSGRTVRGMVYVEPTSTGASQVFDFARVNLTVTYQLLK